MKKIIIPIIALIVLISGCVVQKDIVEPIGQKAVDCYKQISISKGNPATQFCICMGGEWSVKKSEEGEQGICRIDFKNYGVWEYFDKMNPDDNTYSPKPEPTNKELCEQKGGIWDCEIRPCSEELKECIYPKSIEQCETGGGEWRLFNNGCVDSCGSKPRICTQAVTWGCDCGATKCYGKGEGGCKTDSITGVRLCTEPSLNPSCINDISEPYATQREACEATDGNWMSPEQIPFPIENQIICEENDGKWVDTTKIKQYSIDLGITTKEECDKYQGKCFSGGDGRPISVTKIGTCSDNLAVIEDCLHRDFYENTCLLSLEKEQEIKQGNIAKCICPESRCGIPPCPQLVFSELEGCVIKEKTLIQSIFQ